MSSLHVCSATFPVLLFSFYCGFIAHVRTLATDMQALCKSARTCRELLIYRRRSIVRTAMKQIIYFTVVLVCFILFFVAHVRAPILVRSSCALSLDGWLCRTRCCEYQQLQQVATGEWLHYRDPRIPGLAASQCRDYGITKHSLNLK